MGVKLYMNKTYYECNYYSKRNDNLIKNKSNKIKQMQTKLVAIERDKNGNVTLLLKRVD